MSAGLFSLSEWWFIKRTVYASVLRVLLNCHIGVVISSGATTDGHFRAAVARVRVDSSVTGHFSEPA